MNTLNSTPPLMNDRRWLKKRFLRLYRQKYVEEVTAVDEAERIMSNSYLAEKLEQSRKDMADNKGKKILLAGL